MPFEGVEVQRIESLRYEDYGQKNEYRLLYVEGQIGLKDKGISYQHGLFKFKDGKYHAIEMLKVSEGVFQLVRIPQSRLCVVFNNKNVKIFDMADNYKLSYEKIVTDGVISVAVSKLKNKLSLLAIFTKNELVSIFKLSSSSSPEDVFFQFQIEPFYSFSMKFYDSVIRASSSFIDPEGYLAITALIGEGKFVTRVIDYCNGVIKHEVQGEAYPKEYRLDLGSYILADCNLTDLSLRVKVESHYLRDDQTKFISVISSHDTLSPTPTISHQWLYSTLGVVM